MTDEASVRNNNLGTKARVGHDGEVEVEVEFEVVKIENQIAKSKDYNF